MGERRSLSISPCLHCLQFFRQFHISCYFHRTAREALFNGEIDCTRRCNQFLKNGKTNKKHEWGKGKVSSLKILIRKIEKKWIGKKEEEGRKKKKTINLLR